MDLESKKKLAVIIPIFSESESIEELLRRLRTVMDGLKIPSIVCFVDDGSTDDSLAKIKAAAVTDKRIKYLSFSRNFGHQTAIFAGLKEINADVYVVMDGDLQDPPEMIPRLLAKWQEGFEVVYCIRNKRQEGFLKRAAYSAFYKFLHLVSYLDIPLDTGDFCLMGSRVVDQLKKMDEHNHFVRGLRTWIGYRQIGINYERDGRFAGKSKYSFWKLLKLAYDGIISFSFAPLKATVNLGFMISFLSFVSAGYLIIRKILYDIPLVGWTSIFVLVLFIGGIQMLTIGILGEYIGRIFDEVKKRPLYLLKEKSE